MGMPYQLEEQAEKTVTQRVQDHISVGAISARDKASGANGHSVDKFLFDISALDDNNKGAVEDLHNTLQPCVSARGNVQGWADDYGSG